MLNHSTILLGGRFKRLPYPESIFKDYVLFKLHEVQVHLFGQKTKILESNNPQEPCYVFVQYQTRKALEDRMLRALQHYPPVFSQNSNGTSKRRQGRGRIGEDLGWSNIPFQTLRAELWSCEMTRSTDPLTLPSERLHWLCSIKIIQTMTRIKW